MKIKSRFITLIIFNALFSAHPEDYKDFRLVNGNVLKIKGIAFANDYVTVITDTSTKKYYYSEVDPIFLPESEVNKIRSRIEDVYNKSESLKQTGQHIKAARGYKIVLQHKQYIKNDVLEKYLASGIEDKANGKIFYNNKWMTASEVNTEKDLAFENKQIRMGKVEYKGSWLEPHEQYEAKAKDQAIKLIKEMSPDSLSVRLVARVVNPKFVVATVERADRTSLIDKTIMLLGIDTSKMVSGDVIYPKDLYWTGTMSFDSDAGGTTIHGFHTDREEAIRFVMSKSKLFDEEEYKRLKVLYNKNRDQKKESDASWDSSESSVMNSKADKVNNVLSSQVNITTNSSNNLITPRIKTYTEEHRAFYRENSYRLTEDDKIFREPESEDLQNYGTTRKYVHAETLVTEISKTNVTIFQTFKGRSLVLPLHPVSTREPTVVKFDKLTQNSVGKITIWATGIANDKTGRLNVQKNGISVWEVTPGQQWHSKVIEFNHESVSVECHATRWFNDWCYITYDIELKQ